MPDRDPSRGAATGADLRRRITYLMLFRVVLITGVLGVTFALNLASPEQLARGHSIAILAIIVLTYLLSIAYAILLPRVRDPLRFADVQLGIDLVITTALVHTTGGAQSGYTFFYPLSIVGAATLRYRRGAHLVAAASVALLVTVALLGWLQLLPPLPGQRMLPFDLGRWQLGRHLMLNIGACTAIAFLAGNLGEQLARSGETLAEERVRTADLATQSENVIRCLSSGLVTIDDHGLVTTFNDAASEILRVGRDAALGRPIAELVPEIEPLLVALEERQSLRRGEVVTRLAGATREPIPLGMSVSPLMNHRDEVVGQILNFQDLTELRRMEVQVRRAERLAAIGGVAAGVAHEIRNPLASISGCIELLRGAALDGDNRALMDIVLREVDRLNGLVSELLDYARPRTPLPLRIELGALLDETVRVFVQDKAKARVEARLAPPHGEAWVQADPGQLRQVVWNLLRNGAEAMPDGGPLAVSLQSAREEGWAEIAVTDRGIGIAPEDVDRIFEPFFTTKVRGNGLGLATVHRIVTEHGGSIAVASRPGEGTRVTVRLPLA